MKRTIKSTFTYERGKWDRKTNQYYDRTYLTKEVELEMLILNKGDRTILEFVGGPTGWESYQLSGYFEGSVSENDTFCICAGTINSYACCVVSSKDVLDFIKDWKRETGEKLL